MEDSWHGTPEDDLKPTPLFLSLPSTDPFLYLEIILGVHIVFGDKIDHGVPSSTVTQKLIRF